MKFWIDENVPKRIATALTQAGHEAIKTPKGEPDPVVLSLALGAKAVIITRDQDFERLVLTEKRPSWGVIWLRAAPKSRLDEVIAKLLRLVKTHGSRLSTSFVTLSLPQTDIIALS